MTDKQKLKEFHESVIEDYNRSLEIEDISTVKVTDKVDLSSIQIGMRTLISEEVFESLYQSFGREVAIGETSFLIDKILTNKDIQKLKIDRCLDFTNHLDFNKTIIIISTKFYVEIFTKLVDKIAYGSKNPLLYGAYPIVLISEKILGNKIILLERDTIFIEKELFTDELTGKKEKINVITKDKGLNVEVMIRSAINIRDIDIERIKILELEE